MFTYDVLRGFFGSTLHHYSTAGFKTFSFLLPQASFAMKVRADSPQHTLTAVGNVCVGSRLPAILFSQKLGLAIGLA